MTARRTRVFAIVTPIALTVLAMCLSIYGWHNDPQTKLGVTDLIYKALRSIGLSEAYADVGGGLSLNPAQMNWPRLALNIARWIGVVVAFWAVLSLFYNTIRSTWLRLVARGRSGHTIILGHSPLARRLAHTSALHKQPCTHLALDATLDAHRRLIRLPYIPGEDDDLQSAGAGHARRIIFAMDDDARAVELAMATQTRHRGPSIALRLNDPWLALRLHTLPGADKLRAFTEASATARDIIRRHPPYLLAQDQSQARLHLLLAGDHDWCEALMVETIVSAITLAYGKPSFTFLTIDPDGFRARLTERYPELSEAADTIFLTARHGAHAPLSPARPDDITGLTKVTAVYAALADEAQALSCAIALRDLLRDIPGFTAAIFVRAGGTDGLPRPAAGSALAPLTLVPFGALDDIARATGLVSVRGEAAEKAWHQAYRRFAPQDKQAAVPWDELPEEFRISNQRGVAHMYAKLFDAGFNLRPWLKSHDPAVDLPTLAKGEKLCPTQNDRTRLAVLEHERWIADRRMSGWRSGPTRDNARKIHDNIVPFDALTDELKNYDYQFVDLLDSLLKQSSDGLKRG